MANGNGQDDKNPTAGQIKELMEAGELHHRAGNLDQARQLYAQVLELAPDHADAYNLLGLLGLQTNQPDVAEEFFQTAIALTPDDPVYHCNLATSFYSRDRLDEAEAAYRKAIGLEPDYGEALMNLGTVLKQRENYPEALRCLDQAAQQRPRDPLVFALLAETSFKLGDYENAENFARAAANLEPDNPRALSTLVHALNLLARPDEAFYWGKHWIELDPGNLESYLMTAQACQNLGYRDFALDYARKAHLLAPDDYRTCGMLAASLVGKGEWDEALALNEKALEIAPDDRELIAQQAHILERLGRYEEAFSWVQPIVSGKTTFTASALDAFVALAKKLGYQDKAADLFEQVLHKEIPQMAKIPLLFRAGALYDSMGKYDKAFHYYKEANELKPSRYFKQETEEFYDTMCSVVTPQMLAEAPRPTTSSRRPIFIVGMPRSGTSLTEQILAAHPEVFGAGELNEMGWISQDLRAALQSSKDYPACLPELTRDVVDRNAARYLDHISRLSASESLRVTDKMPMNFIHLGLISILFPEAKIIHCNRDPLDTCLSCYFQNFGAHGLGYTYDLRDLGHYYRLYQRLMGHWRDTLRMPIYELQYEAMVSNPPAEVARLLEFCDLEWDDACLAHHKSDLTTKTASYNQVRQPIYTQSKQRWKRYRKHLGPLVEALGMEDFPE